MKQQRLRFPNPEPARPKDAKKGKKGGTHRPERSVSREQKEQRRRRHRQVAAGVGLLVLGALLYAGWVTASGALKAKGVFRLHAIEVSGNAHVSRAQILARLKVPANTELSDVDLAHAAEAVSAQPWVRAAAVRRLYPGTLAVTVVERTPAALIRSGDSLLLVDEEGVVMGPPRALPETIGLPVMVGVGGVLRPGQRIEPRLVATAAHLTQAWPRPGSVVDVSRPADPVLIAEGMRIHPGMSDYPLRFARLSELMPELRKSGGTEKLEVDLRFQDRVVTRSF